MGLLFRVLSAFSELEYHLAGLLIDDHQRGDSAILIVLDNGHIELIKAPAVYDGTFICWNPDERRSVELTAEKNRKL